MFRKISFNLFGLILLAFLAACGSGQTDPTPTTDTNLPNPASVFCEQQGNRLEVVTAADGSQSGMCIFPDGSRCDEWAYFRGECQPSEVASVPTEIPTALPVDPGVYQGWWTYTHPVYNFSLMLPKGWTVEETTGDTLLSGHLLSLHPKGEAEKASIRMTFRRAGEQTLLWPTGVGQGEFVSQGTLPVAGEPVQRKLLVCPGGEVTSIWYQQGEGLPNITRGDVEFGFIFNASPTHCEAGFSLGGKVQQTGEMIIASLSTPSSGAPTSPTYWPTTGWRSTAPEEQGMDSEKLAQMVEYIQQEKLNLHSLLIVRNGYLVNELYVYPYSAEQVEYIFSVTKSVIGTLTGIAVQKGYIQDVEQPLSSLLPDQDIANLNEEKKAITVEDLLTMTSGLDCHENPAPGEAFMQASQNWVQFVLGLPMAAQPGTKFNYCTSAIEVLSAVLQNATGMSAREFANQNLFAPLGIGTISEARWPSDPQGVTTGGYGLALTPGEMAKLGYLFLNQGQWDGKTIVPASWVSTSTTSHANQGQDKEYGYLWWIDPGGKWYAALGLHGQHIFVYPSENLVVVFTADLPATKNADLIPLQELLDQYILPAIKSNRPLPANPNNLARLQAEIQTLAQPQRTAPPPLPPIAAEISGKAYALAENPFGWQTITFNFQDNVDEFAVSVDSNGVTGELAIGLDNIYRMVTNGDSTFPEGLRGSWENEDTLVLEVIYPGQMLQFTYRIQFSGDAIHIVQQEKYSGNVVELQGTLTNQ